VRSQVAQLFDAMAGSYEDLEPWYEHLYATLHAILREALARPSRGARALDAGCGSGFQAAVLGDLGYHVHGVDISPGLLALARRRGAAPHLVLASVEDLPYADGVFDAVSCCGSTLSFVERPARALAELGRVLRPRGVLLLECEHKWSLDLGWMLASALVGDCLGYGVTLGEAWRQVARPLGEGFVARYPGYGALRFFTVTELDAMLAGARLVRRRVWGVHALTNLIPSTVLHHPRVGRGLQALFAVLRASDALLARAGMARWFASSLVVLAERAHDVAPPVALPASTAVNVSSAG
jgi:SAM-dependent methyltransferase